MNKNQTDDDKNINNLTEENILSENGMHIVGEEDAKEEIFIPSSPVTISKSRAQSAKNWTNSFFKHNFQTVTMVILGATTIGAASWGLNNQFKLNSLSKDFDEARNELTILQNDPTLIAKNEAKNIVETVGKLIVLPAEEQPTIATVTDLSKLQSQPFFKNANVGDKVLIYNTAKKAILFRPTESRVIEYAPLETNDQQEGNVAGAETQKPNTKK